MKSRRALGIVQGDHRSGRRGRIGIIGGGIVGAMLAYFLSRRGAEVVLFEKARPAAGVTGSSFAWINASYAKKPYHYHALNRLGAEGWLQLDRELAGELQLQWTGSLVWQSDQDRAHGLERQVAAQQAWGYPTYLIDEDELRRLEENIAPGPVRAAAFAEAEGHVDPVRATQLMLRKAQAYGAKVECPSEVHDIEMRSGKLRGVRTTAGDFQLDVLVIAAGVDTARLAGLVGLRVPLIDAPGILAHTEPMPKLIHRVVRAPGAAIKQEVDGRIVTGPGFGGHPGVDSSPGRGEQLLSQAAHYLPALREARLNRLTLGWRTMPADEHPIVGFQAGAPDVYLAVMHSGVTLAPVIGRLAALEILDNARVEMLEPYRLSRFEKKQNAVR